MDKQNAKHATAEQDCSSCKHYSKPEEGHACGRCNYPLPEWIMIGCSGGGFVSDICGADCVIYEMDYGKGDE